MKNRDIYQRRYKIQETLYIGQYTSVPFKVLTLEFHTVLSVTTAALSYFPEFHQWPEISSFSKVILVLGKSRGHRAPNMGCRGAESPGWFDVSPKNSAWDVMHEWVCCHDEAANHHVPIAIASGIIRIVSIEECSSLTQNLMQIYPFTCSVILNAVATQYTCSLNGIYCPYWLVQWSRHFSRMYIPVPLLGF